MNFKKIAALTAASAILSFSALSVTGMNVFADEEETAAEAVQESSEESETLLSKDALWHYTIVEDEEGNKSASLDEYFGHDTALSIPSKVDDMTVTHLGEYAFYENTDLTEVTIPATITDFGNFSFFGCTSLKEFKVDPDNEIYTARDGVLMSKDNQLFICYPPAKGDKEYTVPDGTLALNPSAFAVCKSLEKVNLPDSLQSIDLYCFAECEKLNNVVIPEKVDMLDMFSFTGCTALDSITLPEEMHVIGAGAFYKCTSLSSIEFPKYLMEIGQGAFVSTGFTEIEIPPTVQEIGYSAFGYTTDQQGQLTPMSSFTVKGLSGSQAQTYCGENENVTFVAIDEDYTTPDEENSGKDDDDDDKNDDKGGLSKGAIAGICGGAVCVAAGIVILIVMLLKRRSKGVTADDTPDRGTDSENLPDTEDDDSEKEKEYEAVQPENDSTETESTDNTGGDDSDRNEWGD